MNGQLIVAMLLAGFTAPMDDGLNPSFAISELSLRAMTRPGC